MKCHSKVKLPQQEPAASFGAWVKPRVFFLALFFLFSFVFLSTAAVDPVVVELHYQNGIKFYKRGRYDRAIQEFEKTLSLDAKHQEAQEYLQKAKEAKEDKKVVDVKKSKQAEIENSYDEGSRLYRQHDWEEALKAFDKVLELKPVDEYASFYKERCEIFISRKIAKEKKGQDKKNFKEKQQKEKLDRKKANEIKKFEEQAVLKKRAQINRERRQAQSEKAVQAGGAKGIKQEKSTMQTMKEARNALREEKRQKAQDVRQEKLQAKKQAQEEKKNLARERKEEKIARHKEMMEEKKMDQEERKAALKERNAQRRSDKKAPMREKKKVKKEAGAIEEEKAEEPNIISIAQEKKEMKALYLEGVEYYGRKQYEEAIASFESVIKAEKNGRKIYTLACQRLLDKAKKKLSEKAKEK